MGANPVELCTSDGAGGAVLNWLLARSMITCRLDAGAAGAKVWLRCLPETEGTTSMCRAACLPLPRDAAPAGAEIGGGRSPAGSKSEFLRCLPLPRAAGIGEVEADAGMSLAVEGVGE